MAEKSINIVIANRTYPVSVQEGSESEVHAAARVITDMLREFEASYSVKDKQDLLAMCALHLAVKTGTTTGIPDTVLEDHLERLRELDRKVSSLIH